MADLTFVERHKLEKFFEMRGGYVLGFSNRTFQEFIIDSVAKDIDDQRYNYASCSKANRLRCFWDKESNYIVGKLTIDLVDFALTFEGKDEALAEECREIGKRLVQSAPVPEISAIEPNTNGKAFEALAKSVRSAIENDEPETGLDRLHTFVVKYVRTLCERRGISTERGKPLHSMFGEYVKHLRSNDLLESTMSERILKSCISTLEAFNDVRNNQSFAHDNEILSYNESLLIFNHVTAAVRFLNSLEEKEAADSEVCVEQGIDEIPF